MRRHGPGVTKASEWPSEGLEAVPACPICGSGERTLLHESLEDRIFFAAPGRWDMWQCAKCRTAWLDPRPDSATIGLAYRHYYTHALPEEPVPQSAIARFRAALGNGYRNWRFGTRLTPASPLGPLVALAARRLREQIDVSFRFLPRPLGRGPRVLDIGCGNGAFLGMARAAGWVTCGTEPDAAARSHAEAAGHDVRVGLDDWAGSEATFDAVTINHVIEHVHDPAALLAKALQLLRPGGHLFIDTPNVDAVGHGLYGRHWRGLEPPRHLVLFSRDTLGALIRAAGFGAVRFRPQHGALPFTAGQSRRIADGLDPYGDGEASEAQPWPSARQLQLAVIGAQAEFLTVTARKPR